MSQNLKRTGFCLILFVLGGCGGKQDKQQAVPQQPSTVQDNSQATNESSQDQQCLQDSNCSNQTQPEASLSCRDLGIPSWNATVEALAIHYCESCHNDQFAWDDVKLNSYDEFVKNADASITRIVNRNLSFSLPTTYANQFITWYESGMPFAETDCQTR